ncbi:MAG: TIGR03643 family protein [Candidatus Puniceispirillaceae bacterium]
MMENKDEIIEMALSDKVPFATIEELYGLNENQVKRLMQSELRRGSYKAWRKRVEKFSAQRSSYKQSSGKQDGRQSETDTCHPSLV